jgi:hypothetical protein
VVCVCYGVDELSDYMSCGDSFDRLSENLFPKEGSVNSLVNRFLIRLLEIKPENRQTQQALFLVFWSQNFMTNFFVTSQSIARAFCFGLTAKI